LACGQPVNQVQPVMSGIQIQRDTCDNPDADIKCCFSNSPEHLTNKMTIAGPSEQGDRLVISGSVFKADGKTLYPGVIIYAYHTDHTGLYSKNGNESGFQKWHGRLHGWCQTDHNGYYEIHTIRPAPYPDHSMPAHIHSAIKTGTGPIFYISDFVFKDDSLVNEKYLSSLINSIGGTGIVDLHRNAENTWVGKRDLVLKY